MACRNCAAETPGDFSYCPACPRTEPGDILPRLVVTPGAESWDDCRSMQWRDALTGKDYFALDHDGDAIVAGGLQECTVALVEARR